VVAGLHSLAAATLGGDEPPEEDAFVCGDDADAKDLGLAVADRVCDGRALDAGPLASARALEGLTAVIVNLNRRYRGRAGIRVTGLPR
jgi:predicted dinucleotide-binding enzyme